MGDSSDDFVVVLFFCFALASVDLFRMFTFRCQINAVDSHPQHAAVSCCGGKRESVSLLHPTSSASCEITKPGVDRSARPVPRGRGEPRDLHVLKCDTHERIFSRGPLICGTHRVFLPALYLSVSALTSNARRVHVNPCSGDVAQSCLCSLRAGASRYLLIFVAGGVVRCCGGRVKFAVLKIAVPPHSDYT